ncbi:MAG: ABC transporter ATP-binding protein [Erysipelotrichaceae bacterium]|nr:ABC transporter ATP-binding protein [Erysipelotrichaceae bacterium]
MPSSEVAKRLMKYVLRHKYLTLAAVVTTLCGNLAALYIPHYSGLAIDAIGEMGHVNFDNVLRLCGFMMVCIVLNSVLAYTTQLLLIRISSSITAEMRREVFDHLLEMPVNFFDRNAAGDIISRISYDIDTINASLSSDIVTIATSVITVVGSFIMMMRISRTLCIVFFITTPLIFYITRHRARVVRPLFSKRSRKLGELNGFVEEMLSGHKTIKAYGQEKTILGRFDSRNEEAVTTYYEADYQGSIVGPTVTFINNLSLAMISGLGGVLFLNKAISIGNISAFILYSKRFSGPISGAAEVMAEIQSAFSASRRVFALLDEPAEKKDDEDAVVLDHVQGSVAMEDVRFSYVPEREIIHGLSLSAEPGRMIAIVGPTGAGKTTIINLLMRFYDPDSGVIRVDGHDILHCTRDSLRRQFSMVLQDTWLFQGTIFENIAYGSENATMDDVVRVCKAVEIHDFVMSLKDGYDTVLSDDGVNISKGQKQLMTIARAMLNESKMLILDEATSNVDSTTEQKIQRAMLQLCRGKTTFVIAHRLSTIKEADMILVLQNGTVIERGTHEQLLAAKGFYASLFNAQWEA